MINLTISTARPWLDRVDKALEAEKNGATAASLQRLKTRLLQADGDPKATVLATRAIRDTLELLYAH